MQGTADVFFSRKVFSGVGGKLAQAFYLNKKYLSLHKDINLKACTQ